MLHFAKMVGHTTEGSATEAGHQIEVGAGTFTTAIQIAATACPASFPVAIGTITAVVGATSIKVAITSTTAAANSTVQRANALAFVDVIRFNIPVPMRPLSSPLVLPPLPVY